MNMIIFERNQKFWRRAHRAATQRARRTIVREPMLQNADDGNGSYADNDWKR